MTRLLITCCCCAAFALSGCGEAAPPFETAVVKGKVTLPRGKQLDPEETVVRFIPQGVKAIDGKHARTGEAHLAADGTFKSVTTYRANDGLIVGKHKVVLESYVNSGSRLFDARYSDSRRTPWEVEVKKDGPNEFQLEIKK